jgi:hypothetical protein
MATMSASVRKKKNVIGVIAIVLLIIFTVLAFLSLINFLEWLIADLAVALIANLLLRRVGKQQT